MRSLFTGSLLNCKILGFLDLELRTEKSERDVYRRVPSLLVLADYFNLVPLPTLQVNALTLHPLSCQVLGFLDLEF